MEAAPLKVEGGPLEGGLEEVAHGQNAVQVGVVEGVG